MRFLRQKCCTAQFQNADPKFGPNMYVVCAAVTLNGQNGLTFPSPWLNMPKLIIAIHQFPWRHMKFRQSQF